MRIFPDLPRIRFPRVMTQFGPAPQVLIQPVESFGSLLLLLHCHIGVAALERLSSVFGGIWLQWSGLSCLGRPLGVAGQLGGPFGKLLLRPV